MTQVRILVKKVSASGALLKEVWSVDAPSLCRLRDLSRIGTLHAGPSPVDNHIRTMSPDFENYVTWTAPLDEGGMAFYEVVVQDTSHPRGVSVAGSSGIFRVLGPGEQPFPGEIDFDGSTHPLEEDETANSSSARSPWWWWIVLLAGLLSLLVVLCVYFGCCRRRRKTLEADAGNRIENLFHVAPFMDLPWTMKRLSSTHPARVHWDFVGGGDATTPHRIAAPLQRRLE